MPLPLLIALILAFGLGLPADDRPLGGMDLARRMALTGAGAASVGLLGAAVGAIVAARARRGSSSSGSRRWFSWGLRLVVALGLMVFAWTLVVIEWPRVVDRGLGLRGVALLEEFCVLLPYLAGQLLAWCGLYRAERALRSSGEGPGLGRYLLRKSRQSLGMILPVAMIYVLGRDVLRWAVPRSAEDPAIQFGGTCLVAICVFILSPAFVRLTWPTRRMEDGPLRDRLERLSRRLNFRCSDIRVWDTGGVVINAGVTGAVPWFRYVLVTDAMIDCLDPSEIEAVFGHEIGHVARRHLPYFALFFLGSAGLMGLGAEILGRFWDVDAALARLGNPTVAGVAQGAGILGIWGVYFFLVFGYLSRQFERQADLFGARAVSCGRKDCPPHLDLNAPGVPEGPPGELCPMGLRTFADALANVAALNGMSPRASSWRHGSIARRIAFLHRLESRPEGASRFEASVLRLRWAMAIVLALASAAAIAVMGRG